MDIPLDPDRMCTLTMRVAWFTMLQLLELFLIPKITHRNSLEDTRLPKCVMFGEMVGGAGCVGGQEKEWMGCFLDDLRAFGINADQWTTAAQDEGK